MAFPDTFAFPIQCVPAAALSATVTVRPELEIPTLFHGAPFVGEIVAVQMMDLNGITGDNTDRYSFKFCRGTVAAPITVAYWDLVTGQDLTADVAKTLTIEGALNTGSSTLNGAITKTATSLVVTSAATFPAAASFYVRVDEEIMLVTSVSTTTFTITRAQCGTVAAAHASGATIVTNGNYASRRITAADRPHVVATKNGTPSNVAVTARFNFWISPNYQPAGITLPV